MTQKSPPKKNRTLKHTAEISKDELAALLKKAQDEDPDAADGEFEELDENEPAIPKKKAPKK